MWLETLTYLVDMAESYRDAAPATEYGEAAREEEYALEKLNTEVAWSTGAASPYWTAESNLETSRSMEVLRDESEDP
jgi:hypothetical protein